MTRKGAFRDLRWAFNLFLKIICFLCIVAVPSKYAFTIIYANSFPLPRDSKNQFKNGRMKVYNK